jgi:NitT/TauT family transport system ATP-binding protein
MSLGPAPPAIALRRVSKRFASQTGPAVEALQDVSFELPAGSFSVVLGPSGCGKTTLLRLVDGLITPDSGQVQVEGGPPQPGPGIGVVFQSFRLLPWRSVAQNVGFVLEVARVSRSDRRERVAEALATVGLTRFADAYPAELSGGMKQRAALARALVTQPRVLLMDEPFASLDAQSRELMQAELLRIWQKRRCLVLFVTHSVDEALLLGERVILMAPRPGRVAEIVAVNIPQPRSGDAARAHPRFLELRAYLWERIRTMVLSDPESDFYGR